MNTTYTCYASDEDVALLSPSDVGPLFPVDQVIASGDDGSFDPSDRWTLHSASTAFEDCGLRSGHVVRLIGPVERFQPPGVLFGVAEVAAHSVRLRRLGMVNGLGEPVGPPEGMTGVSFVVTTLKPQLEQASREVDGLLGLHQPEQSPHLSQSLQAGTFLRDAVVRRVLARRYATITRDGDTSFATRARLFEASFERLMTQLSVSGNLLHPHQSACFGTRLQR